MTRRRWLGPAVVLAALAVLVLSLGNLGLLNGALLLRGAQNLAVFARDLVPPDLLVLRTVWQAMLETLQIAFVGTMLGFILALPAALAASPVLVWSAVAAAMRLVLAFVRTVPSLLWAIIFVVAVGPNAGAGALAIALYSLGYLGKLFYELFEGVDPEVLEAVRGVGAGRLQLARYALLPEAANGILAQLVFMFEYNVRASSILGFVGAGGIGFYLLGYIQTLQYRRMMTALLVTLAVVVIIDRLSVLLRRRFVLGTTTATPGA